MTGPAVVAPSKPKADGSGDQSRDAAVAADKVPALSLGDDLKSSPSPSTGLDGVAERGMNGDSVAEGARNASGDSEAETERLSSEEPGGEGGKRKRIKREEHSDEERTTNRVVQMDADSPNVGLRAPVSGLGKRKWTRHGNRDGITHEAGNSSSVLSSPGATTHSSKRDASDSEGSLSSPPQVPSKESSNIGSRKRKLQNGGSDDDSHRRRSGASIWQSSSGANVHNHESHGNQHQNNNTKDRRGARSATVPHGPHQRSVERSPSPHARSHRRTASSHSVLQLPNGHVHKKQRKGPPPPVSTREHGYSEGVHSDSSSGSGSSHPFAQSKKLPVDEMNIGSMASAKMPHKKHRDQIGRTHLARACASGDLKSVQLQLKERPEDKNLPDNAGNTPLQIASLEGHVDTVEALLQAGCDVDCRNNEKDTPLIDAIENSRLEVVKLLLKYGANPRLVNAKGFEPLDILEADQENYHAIKRELEKARSKPEARRTSASEDHSGNNSAAQKESGQSSREISAVSPAPKSPAAGSAPRRKNRREATRNDFLWLQPTRENLRDYAGRGDVVAVGHILSQRPEADTESLIAAARGGHDEVLQLLLGIGDGKADPDPLKSPNYRQGQNTPMLAAIGRGNIKVVDLLLAQTDFNPTRRDYQGRTYFELAEDRRGEGWREERDLLKKHFDDYSRTHGKGSSSAQTKRTSSPTRAGRGPENEARRMRGEAPSISQRNARRDHAKDTKRDPVGRSMSSMKERPGEQSAHRKSQRPDAPRETSVASDRDSTILGPPKSYPQKSKMNDVDPAIATSDEVAKPRRKLVSGRDLKDDQARRTSVTSTASSSSGKDKPLRRDSTTARELSESAKIRRDRKPEGIELEKSVVKVTKASGSDPTQNRGKVLSAKDKVPKRDQSGDRVSAIRREGNLKRVRSASPPRSRSRDSEFRKDRGEKAHTKRRRIDSPGSRADEKRVPDGSSGYADTKDPSSKAQGVVKDQMIDKSSRPGRNSESHKAQGRSLDGSQDTTRVSNNGEKKRLSGGRGDVYTDLNKKSKADHRVRDDDKGTRDRGDDLSRKRRPTSSASMPSPRTAEDRDRTMREAREDDEKRKQEEALRKAKEEEEALRKAQEEEALRQTREKEALKKAKEEEEAKKKTEEEARRKVKEEEEAKRREEEARKKAEEEAEALRKAKEEERLRIERQESRRQAALRGELARILSRAQQESHSDRKHVEGERERQLHALRVAEKKRREEEAERQRIEQERKRLEEAERRRCEALPQRLCDVARMDHVRAKSPDEIQKWLPLFYAELPVLNADGMPQPVYGGQEKERWILNVQAAPILGLRDLELSQYTAWTKRNAVMAERIRAWEVVGITVTGRAPRDAHPLEVQQYHLAGQKKFFAIASIFWIKLSDFLDIVPRYPHLHGIKMRTVRIAFGSEEDYLIDPEVAQFYGVSPTACRPTVNNSETTIGQAPAPQVNGYVSPEGVTAHPTSEKLGHTKSRFNHSEIVDINHKRTASDKRITAFLSFTNPTSSLRRIRQLLADTFLRIISMSDGEEPTSPTIPAAEEVEIAADASAGKGQMSVLDALKGVLKLALIHDGLARGLREASKSLCRAQAHMCVLNEACEEEAYKKLVVALCSHHKIPLIKVPDGKQLGEWAGLCVLDREGNARKVVNCSCVVVRDWGEESQERSILLNYFQTEQ
ncbi:MAG: Set3 complex subunit with deacetylase activity, meiotic-specific repressor of sporulation proteins [Geoglossum simile]|nr:MAG: Set3 complex subunit with deacetylase activity, meiotic-specific repressor of sporulation proteins [Geoglossum simile]